MVGVKKHACSSRSKQSTSSALWWTYDILVDDSQLLRDGFGNKHGQGNWVEKIHRISPKPEQDAASLSLSFLSCIHSKLIESLRFAKRAMVHEVGGGLPSPRITTVSMKSRACLLAGMSGLPDLLKLVHVC